MEGQSAIAVPHSTHLLSILPPRFGGRSSGRNLQRQLQQQIRKVALSPVTAESHIVHIYLYCRLDTARCTTDIYTQQFCFFRPLLLIQVLLTDAVPFWPRNNNSADEQVRPPTVLPSWNRQQRRIIRRQIYQLFGEEIIIRLYPGWVIAHIINTTTTLVQPGRHRDHQLVRAPEVLHFCMVILTTAATVYAVCFFFGSGGILSLPAQAKFSAAFR